MRKPIPPHMNTRFQRLRALAERGCWREAVLHVRAFGPLNSLYRQEADAFLRALARIA